MCGDHRDGDLFVPAGGFNMSNPNEQPETAMIQNASLGWVASAGKRAQKRTLGSSQASEKGGDECQGPYAFD